jgi:hypothetical protein
VFDSRLAYHCDYIGPILDEPTGIVGYSPMRAKEYLAGLGVLSGDPSAYENFILSSAKGITYRDSWDVATCDLMLVNLMGAETISIGTVLEVGMGYSLIAL